MRALVRFSGIVGGKPKTFNPGDTITQKEAEELGLADKPELAAADKGKSA